MLPLQGAWFLSQVGELRSCMLYVQFCSVQSLSCVRLFATPRTTARLASLFITNSWSLPKLMSMMPSNHLILCHPIISSSAIPFSSCLQSFPASGSFPISQFLTYFNKNVKKTDENISPRKQKSLTNVSCSKGC